MLRSMPLPIACPRRVQTAFHITFIRNFVYEARYHVHSTEPTIEASNRHRFHSRYFSF